MKADVEAVRKAVAGTAPVTAFVEIGQNPLYTVGTGTLIDELVTLAGGTNVVKQPGYVGYSAEQLIAADPQVYLATKGSSSDPSAITSRAGFNKLTAVKNGRIVILDDNLVSRPGPRFVLGLKQIAQGLHPDAFKGK
jgi:iron complex transport system substrate-binding protein